MGEVNVVPRDEVSFETMSEFAGKQGWKVDKKSVKEAEDEESPEYIWRIPKGTVTLVQSSPLRRDYFMIDAPHPADIAAEISRRFPLYDSGEILQNLVSAQTEEEKIDALHLVAAADFDAYDETIYQAVAQGLRDPEALVRLAAITAAFYLHWKQFRPLLIDAKETDESANIRATSSNLLDLTEWDRG